jgi:myosin heavy subunit
LIALNPFRPLPLYTPLVMQRYMTSDPAEVLKPHPFDISRRAYNSMLTDGRNQAILISGESGAVSSTTVVQEIFNYHTNQ